MTPDYFNGFDNLRMARSDSGVLEVAMHTDGGPIVWNGQTHREFVDAFYAIGRDRRNRVVVFTGTGDEWMVQIDRDGMSALAEPWVWSRIMLDGKKILDNLLDIEAPMIAAINGPARVHSELALCCDCLLAADTAEFQDRHLEWGIVPGDGVHVLWPEVLGTVRGRYFLFTGQRIGAEEALRLGVVNEVMPADALLPRARALAEELAQRPTLALRYSRVAFTQPLKRKLAEGLGYGLALEGLSAAGLGRTP